MIELLLIISMIATVATKQFLNNTYFIQNRKWVYLLEIQGRLVGTDRIAVDLFVSVETEVD